MVTGVGLLLRVDTLVAGEVALLDKLLSALGAPKTEKEFVRLPTGYQRLITEYALVSLAGQSDTAFSSTWQ